MSPSPSLSHVVKCYWLIRNPHNRTRHVEFMHPEGGTGIIFNFGDQIAFDQSVLGQGAMFDGTNTRSRGLALSGDINAIGIRFQPAGASALLPFSLGELKNQHISLSEAGLKASEPLFHQLGDQQTLIGKISVIETWLHRNLKPEHAVSSMLKCSVEALQERGGLLAIEQLARQLGANRRKIERLFNRQLGMTPKEYSSILRVDAARRYLKQSNLPFTDIAHELGYFDQAHFIKQFQSVVGLTPAAYRRRNAAR